MGLMTFNRARRAAADKAEAAKAEVGALDAVMAEAEAENAAFDEAAAKAEKPKRSPRKAKASTDKSEG